MKIQFSTEIRFLFENYIFFHYTIITFLNKTRLATLFLYRLLERRLVMFPIYTNGMAQFDCPWKTSKPCVLRLQSLHAVDIGIVINFLPTVFNQLLRLLSVTTSEDVALNSVRVLVHCVKEVHNVQRDDILRTYVKVRNSHSRFPQHLQKTLKSEGMEKLWKTHTFL